MIHWNWTTSTGVLERPYCQMEIRHAVKLRKPIVLLHGEAELRAHGVTHGSFDKLPAFGRSCRERRAVRFF